MTTSTLRAKSSAPADGLATMVEPGPAWAARAPETEPAIIPGVITAGGFCVVGAEPKVGKTWWLLSVALAVSSGLPLLGEQPVAQSGRVLLILTEGSHRKTVERFSALAIGYGLEPVEALGQVDVVWRQGIDLIDSNVVSFLRARAYPLVIVDVLRDVWHGDENSAADVGKLLRGLRPVMNSGSTVAVALHNHKPGENSRGRRPGMRIRGSSAFYGAADSLVYMEPSKSSRNVKVTFESRDDAPAAPMLMTLPAGRVDGTEGVRLDYRPLMGTSSKAEKLDAVIAAVTADPGISGNGVVAAVGGRKTDVLTALHLAQDAGKVALDDGRWFPKDGNQFPAFSEGGSRIGEPVGTTTARSSGSQHHPLKGGMVSGTGVDRGAAGTDGDPGWPEDSNGSAPW